MPPALTVLMNAGPWLPVPPPDYGGIENVVATLVPELRARGHRVVLATVGESELDGRRARSASSRPASSARITGPYNQMMGIAHAHMRAVLDRLAEGDVDLVHDHLEVVGPAILRRRPATRVPPVLQTLHWDLAKHPDFYGGFDGAGGSSSPGCPTRSSPGRTRRCAGRRSARSRWPPRCRSTRSVAGRPGTCSRWAG